MSIVAGWAGFRQSVSCTGTIAANELSNLLRSKLILIVGAVYVLLFARVLLEMPVPGDQYYVQMLDSIHMMGVQAPDLYVFSLLWGIAFTLQNYGAFVGIVLGVSTVAIDRYGNTLGNLAAKPVSRRAIVNGKLLGCSLFILSAFALTLLIFSAYIAIRWGGAFWPIAAGYFVRLPIVAAVSLLYVLVFFAISLLISLIVTDLAYALIVSVLIKYFLIDANAAEIADKLASLAGMSLDGFRSLMPDGIMSGIFKKPTVGNNILRPSDDLIQALSTVMPDLIRLSVYVLILVGVSYVVFMRRDLK